jgi:hypothetical protein
VAELSLPALIWKFSTEGADCTRVDLSKSDTRALASAFVELLSLYARDKNSSTIREMVTVAAAGYDHNVAKIGFNGQKALVSCEAKPRNVSSTEAKKKRHDGGGNYTDLTYERVAKYTEQGVQLLPSGFIDGRLAFVFEFPFGHAAFRERLINQLDRQFNGDRPAGMFLRSATFSFKHYRDCPDLRVHYVNRDLVRAYPGLFSRELYAFLANWPQGGPADE